MFAVRVKITNPFSFKQIRDMFSKVEKAVSFLDCDKIVEEYVRKLELDENYNIKKEPFTYICSYSIYFIQSASKKMTCKNEKTLYVGMTMKMDNLKRLELHRKLLAILVDYYERKSRKIFIRFGDLYIYAGMQEWLPFNTFHSDEEETRKTLLTIETIFITLLNPPYNKKISFKVKEQVLLIIENSPWKINEVEIIPQKRIPIINIPPKESIVINNMALSKNMELNDPYVVKYLRAGGVLEEFKKWKENFR